MTSILTVIFSLILVFSEKKHLFQKPIKWGNIAIIAIIITTGVISGVQSCNDDIEKKGSADTIIRLKAKTDALIGQVDTMRKESKISQREYNDSLGRYHYNTTELLAKYGLKVDTLTGQVKKIEVNNEIPHIALLPERGAGFKADYSANRLELLGRIKNDGKGTAFGTDLETIMLCLTGDAIYKLQPYFEPQRQDYDISPNVLAQVGQDVRVDEDLYNSVTVFILVIKGRYFIDAEKTKVRQIKLGVKFNPKSNDVSFYAGSIDELLRKAGVDR